MPDQTINDLVLSECKSLQSEGIPFPSYGSGWGSAPIYQSEAAWDSWIDQQYGGGGSYDIERYRNLVGDLSRNSLIMAAVRFLGDALPEAPLQVKEKEGGASGIKGKSKVIADHKLPALWNTPNDFYSGSTLKRGLAFSIVLSSNAYILKNFNEVGLWPIELWWEPHWTIRPVWPVSGSEFISHYEVNRMGQWLPIARENVIHIRDGIHPYNQRIGLSGNDAILRELYGDGEAANYYASLMAGSGIPGFMVSIDKEMKMDQTKIDQLEAMIVRKTTGDKKGQPLIAKGARAYKLGFNPRELDLRESRYMAEDRFCATQGIPAVVLELGTGVAHSIYKNVEQAQERAWRNYVIPKLTMIEEELNTQLLPDFETKGKDSGRYCIHELSEIHALQEDQNERATRLTDLFEKGVIMRSEVRSGMTYGSSLEGNDEIDKVFYVKSGGALVKPNEEPLASGTQILDMVTGEIRAGAPPPEPNPLEAGNGQGLLEEMAPTAVNAQGIPKKKPVLSLVKALVGEVGGNGLDEDNLKSWTKFPAETESLGIPRSSMPQVLSAHRGAMVQFLKGRGITATKESVLPSTLQPSQAEYSQAKVDKARAFEGVDRPLLVSSDSYIADGHHQWMASGTDSPSEPIPIIRLGVPILELLLELARFPSSGVRDGEDNSKFWTASKALPNGHAGVSNKDVQETIQFLKKHRYTQAAAMIEALPMKVPETKKSNGDSVIIG